MVAKENILSVELQERLNHFQDEFWVPKEKLNHIIEYFISELNRGLHDGTDPLGIPMNAAWVMDYPTGNEKGDYLALDLGGTNMRVVVVHLLGNHKFTTEQSKFKLPSTIRTTKNREDLFGFIAESLGKFLKEKNPNGIPEGKVFPLGFTFSYPCTQTRVDVGVLQRWTKGFDIPGVEGEDVVALLKKDIKKRNLPIKIVSLINDTCGTLVASRYTDPLTEMGCIFGTGVNGAYYEKVSNISKIDGTLEDDILPSSKMLINCEYGSFDNIHKVLPRNTYDKEIDEESPRPGQQTFEKMTSGYYLGELIRKSMLECYNGGVLFKHLAKNSEGAKNLNKAYLLDTSFLSALESDETQDLSETDSQFKETLAVQTTLEERLFAKKLASFIGTRAARLSTCGISAACKKMNYKHCHIAADGSVFMRYPHFPERAAQALSDVWGWDGMKMEDHPIQIVRAQDGSGVGAAIIAALSDIRISKGLSLGMKKN
ncbi:hypothetical protein FOA43_003595 [Brettanomyces nanus]|uniref:Phosphotransferase n=1 Tax=Eeniella nana TaxID=13502 RepID=A0A875S976_EENNA|nr:uncharacterized protein FOA43_003595 [Brettanomyces nanus]QPG76209.1 hypothetical protein FOA43_003595 [Brettanomyces nanus]